MNQVPPLCKTPKTEVNTLCKPSNSTGANKSPFIKSFLFYVPYACLAAMTFPAILSATASVISAVVGFVVALIAAYKEKSLLTVALLACGAVFIVERIMAFAV